MRWLVWVSIDLRLTITNWRDEFGIFFVHLFKHICTLLWCAQNFLVQRHSWVYSGWWKFTRTVSMALRTVAWFSIFLFMWMTQVNFYINVVTLFIVFIIFLKHRCITQKLLVLTKLPEFSWIDMDVQLGDIFWLSAALVVLFVYKTYLILRRNLFLSIKVFSIWLFKLSSRINSLSDLAQNWQEAGRVFFSFMVVKTIWFL